jgi:hypothetical protein
MATVVSITKVRTAITAGGRPIPRKPLIMPAKKNAPNTISVIPMYGDGRNAVKVKSFNFVLH